MQHARQARQWVLLVPGITVNACWCESTQLLSFAGGPASTHLVIAPGRQCGLVVAEGSLLLCQPLALSIQLLLCRLQLGLSRLQLAAALGQSILLHTHMYTCTHTRTQYHLGKDEQHYIQAGANKKSVAA